MTLMMIELPKDIDSAQLSTINQDEEKYKREKI